MIRLRYLIVAVIVLAPVPLVLDWVASPSCADCLDESVATVSVQDAPRPARAADTALPKPAETQAGESVALAPAVANDATTRPGAVRGAPAATARDATAPPRNNGVSFTAARGFGGRVTLAWRVPSETGVDYYLLDRKLKSNGDDAYELHLTMQPVEGTGQYSWTDTPPSDTYTYRLRALASTDQSDAGKTLGTADVEVEYVVGLTIDRFALGSASGLVSVNWTAAQEAGVVSYVLDRRPEGAASYDLNVDVGYPQGDGTHYSLYDDPHGTGTYVYRLRATLSNGTERILAEGGVTL